MVELSGAAIKAGLSGASGTRSMIGAERIDPINQSMAANAASKEPAE